MAINAGTGVGDAGGVVGQPLATASATPERAAQLGLRVSLNYSEVPWQAVDFLSALPQQC